jgi:hypothetical protein
MALADWLQDPAFFLRGIENRTRPDWIAPRAQPHTERRLKGDFICTNALIVAHCVPMGANRIYAHRGRDNE